MIDSWKTAAEPGGISSVLRSVQEISKGCVRDGSKAEFRTEILITEDQTSELSS